MTAGKTTKTGFAVIYKGELIASGEAKAVRSSLEDVWSLKGTKLIDALENKLVLQRIDDAIEKLKIPIKIPNNTLGALESSKRLKKIYDTLKTMKQSNKFNPNKNKLTLKNKKVPLSSNGISADFANTPYLYKTKGNEKNIVKIKLTGNRANDNKLAFELSVINPTDKILNDYVWHHINDFDTTTGTCVMQLVERQVHRFSKPHYGETSLVDYFYQKAIYSKKLSLKI